MPRVKLGQDPYMANDIDITYRIKAERDKKGWSDDELAVKLHLNVRTLQRRYVDPSRFMLMDIRRMAELFKVKTTDLLE